QCQQPAAPAGFLQYSWTLKQCNGFGVGRMGEHVGNAGPDQPEAVAVDQRAGIARQSGGVARHIHHATSARAGNNRQNLERAAARRINQCGIKPARYQSWADTSVVRAATAQSALSIPWCPAVVLAASIRAGSPSTPVTRPARVASGRVKLPSPQNRSRTRSSASRAISSTARLTSARLIFALT